MARLRLGLVGVVIGLLFLAMFARLYSLQVLNAPSYSKLALSNQVQAVSVQPPRGDIVARSGATIVGNTVTEAVTLSRYAAAQTPAVVGRLATVLHMTPTQVSNALKNTQFSQYVPVPIATGVSKPVIVYIAEHQSEFPGVSAQAIPERNYPDTGTAAQMLGYIAPIDPAELGQPQFKANKPGDLVGQSGVEASYNNYLYGKPGVTDLSVNRTGQVVGTLASTAPVPGNTVQLNMDLGLQQNLQSDLANEIALLRNTYVPAAGQYATAPAGAGVVLNAQNGHVLAMASYPTYDPSVWVGGISQSQYDALKASNALLSRPTQALSAPGSTFKLATATAALNDGLITPSYTYNDATGFFTASHCTGGTCVFHDDSSSAQGYVNVTQALTVSDDVFFYNLGDMFYSAYETNGQYGFTPIQQMANAYGLGVGTGIDLPGESAGYIDSLAVDQKLCAQAPKAFHCPATWYAGNNIEMAFGQGATQITPIELAQAYATFANGGTRYQPQVVSGIVNPEGKVVKTFPPVVTGHVPISPANRAAMLQGFIGAVQDPHGTAYGAFQGFNFSKLDVAGKTGTATTNHPVPNALFVAFAGTDINHPQYVVAVEIDQAGYGAAGSAPVARQVLQYLMDHPPAPVTPPKPSPVLIPELTPPPPGQPCSTTSTSTGSTTTSVPSSTTTTSTTLPGSATAMAGSTTTTAGCTSTTTSTTTGAAGYTTTATSSPPSGPTYTTTPTSSSPTYPTTPTSANTTVPTYPTTPTSANTTSTTPTSANTTSTTPTSANTAPTSAPTSSSNTTPKSAVVTAATSAPTSRQRAPP
ncbi:MAG: penicillin-binding protein 2 [Acidimicrobiales bacterium]